MRARRKWHAPDHVFEYEMDCLEKRLIYKFVLSHTKKSGRTPLLSTTAPLTHIFKRFFKTPTYTPASQYFPNQAFVSGLNQELRM